MEHSLNFSKTLFYSNCLSNFTFSFNSKIKYSNKVNKFLIFSQYFTIFFWLYFNILIFVRKKLHNLVLFNAFFLSLIDQS